MAGPNKHGYSPVAMEKLALDWNSNQLLEFSLKMIIAMM